MLIAIAFIIVVEPSCRSVQVTKINPVDHLKYVRIPGGTFLFGCSAGDLECFSWEKRPKRIYAKAFWIGQTEVTQRAYEKVMNKNASLYRGPSRPVDRVGWNDAAAFCKAVGMRLPTGIEWEYAARGGASTARYGKLDDIACFDGNSGDRTHAVAQKIPSTTCSGTSGSGCKMSTRPSRTKESCVGALFTTRHERCVFQIDSGLRRTQLIATWDFAVQETSKTVDAIAVKCRNRGYLAETSAPNKQVKARRFENEDGDERDHEGHRQNGQILQ